MSDEKTEFQEWIKSRVKEVESNISTFEILSSNGYELVDEETSLQISCFMHGPDARPSARYYAGHPGHFFCFKCQIRLSPVDLYAKFNNLRFMEALVELEKRFGIQVKKGKFESDIELPLDRGEKYRSLVWKNVEKNLISHEKKLLRIKNKCTLPEFVSICKMIDSVRWDFEKTKIETAEMVQTLHDAYSKMNEIHARQELFNDWN